MSKKILRPYQKTAVDNVLLAIKKKQSRILLAMAGGAGKTLVASQIISALIESQWNVTSDRGEWRVPRVLFLAKNDLLIDQALGSDFSLFPRNLVSRLGPLEIKKKNRVANSHHIFFATAQTFMGGFGNTPYFGDYPRDFFDLIIADDCFYNQFGIEQQWQWILTYFSPAVHLGLITVPKNRENTSVYRYFGQPVFTYSQKEGIEEGFLAPFKLILIKEAFGQYVYHSDIKQITTMLENIGSNQKTLVFCRNQEHALAVCNLVRQQTKNKGPDYCKNLARISVKNKRYLAQFSGYAGSGNINQAVKSVPAIIATLPEAVGGLDIPDLFNIVILSPLANIAQFKQVMGLGSRFAENKKYLTILDFTSAYERFYDPAWDGQPQEVVVKRERQHFMLREPALTYPASLLKPTTLDFVTA